MFLTATGAWFTSSSEKEDKELTFGQIVLSVDGDNVGSVTHATGNTDTAYMEGVDIMPGDTVSFTLSVSKGTSSEDFWYEIFLTVTAKGKDDSTKTLPVGSYTISTAGQVYSTLSSSEHAGTITLDGTKLGNDWKEAKITISYYVRAVQLANLTETEAKAILESNATDGRWNYASGVVAA